MSEIQGKRLRPCVFFDRDGIVNVSPGPGYVERVEDFHLVPAFFDALRVASDRGYAAVIATNQRGVGIGRMTEADLKAIHHVLIKAVNAVGLSLTDIYVCTADNNAHPNRKPNPGMLLDAARAHALDLSKSWMIGDNEKDILAGLRAGCRTILVAPPGQETEADHHVPDMAACTALLEQVLSRA